MPGGSRSCQPELAVTLVQVVERLQVMQRVDGSIPSRHNTFWEFLFAAPSYH